MRTNLCVFLLCGLFLFISACQPSQNANQTANTAAASAAAKEKWDVHVVQFITGFFTANPNAGVYQGRHEFDGKMPDWTAEGLAKEIARLKSSAKTGPRREAAAKLGRNFMINSCHTAARQFLWSVKQ